ncbi:NuA4 histone acetyltransferase subunit [Entomophthora muscae]|uniref:NuA4 histone acetyltransferase subunit n=1 Tax=Entomophthora muscae TaxID=34485 RepID=A0ACC2TX25_9FUNG|nr:NuA4 histone acetyltransferase subunit [Entomophthora muscae]
MAELAFEKFGAPALYFSSTAVLSAFACGKATGLVIDSGSSVTSVVPVYEGYALKKGIRKQALAGDYISDCIIEGLERQYKYQITPPYQIQSRTAVESGEQPKVVLKPQPAATESYHKAKLQMAVSEFKESTCQVFETLYDKDQVASRPGKPYEFHDGFNTIFGSERYKFPEVLFQPDLLSGQSSDFMGLHHLALDSVASCDVELRPHLLSNIVATGGTTLFPGFIDRLSVELASSAYGQRVKISGAPNAVERRYAAWLGGSILASLGTFHPLWLSKDEFQEGGATALGKKFM